MCIGGQNSTGTGTEAANTVVSDFQKTTSGVMRSNTELDEELSGEVDLEVYIGSAAAKTSGEPSGESLRRAAPTSGETERPGDEDLIGEGGVIDDDGNSGDHFEEGEDEAGEELANWARGLNTEAL